MLSDAGISRRQQIDSTFKRDEELPKHLSAMKNCDEILERRRDTVGLFITTGIRSLRATELLPNILGWAGGFIVLCTDTSLGWTHRHQFDVLSTERVFRRYVGMMRSCVRNCFTHAWHP